MQLHMFLLDSLVMGMTATANECELSSASAHLAGDLERRAAPVLLPSLLYEADRARGGAHDHTLPASVSRVQPPEQTTL